MLNQQIIKVNMKISYEEVALIYIYDIFLEILYETEAKYVQEFEHILNYLVFYRRCILQSFQIKF